MFIYLIFIQFILFCKAQDKECETTFTSRYTTFSIFLPVLFGFIGSFALTFINRGYNDENLNIILNKFNTISVAIVNVIILVFNLIDFNYDIYFYQHDKLSINFKMLIIPIFTSILILPLYNRILLKMDESNLKIWLCRLYFVLQIMLISFLIYVTIGSSEFIQNITPSDYTNLNNTGIPNNDKNAFCWYLKKYEHNCNDIHYHDDNIDNHYYNYISFSNDNFYFNQSKTNLNTPSITCNIDIVKHFSDKMVTFDVLLSVLSLFSTLLLMFNNMFSYFFDLWDIQVEKNERIKFESRTRARTITMNNNRMNIIKDSLDLIRNENILKELKHTKSIDDYDYYEYKKMIKKYEIKKLIKSNKIYDFDNDTVEDVDLEKNNLNMTYPFSLDISN